MDMSFDDDFGDEIICEESGTAEEIEFDLTVGILEEIVLDDKFSNMQNEFCLQNCDIFEDTEENKLIYSDVFQDYTALIESYLERRLSQKGISMRNFESQLEDRKDEISGEIFDLLLSLSDFSEFKDLMLSYKRSKGDRRGSTLPAVTVSQSST
eukprot:CAMPEP_0114466584 /NCGR_PEP_ID=MMETSP0104-20121206/9149_1 /TAXON_ID=37642 ORGANISM="Paraphysomonas imperforata, Strain PA2" /NCGR_SAMPLE_ID=MMETSP0104 /ASSEMBLY_ACC=CAM_ASM_000202 /LENGTH=153 /DNA_ID=CAMNT_0001639957 /DNA_START=113 /DNA_END=574 /DNA_ORIENTATION=-